MLIRCGLHRYSPALKINTFYSQQQNAYSEIPWLWYGGDIEICNLVEVKTYKFLNYFERHWYFLLHRLKIWEYQRSSISSPRSTWVLLCISWLVLKLSVLIKMHHHRYQNRCRPYYNFHTLIHGFIIIISSHGVNTPVLLSFLGSHNSILLSSILQKKRQSLTLMFDIIIPFHCSFLYFLPIWFFYPSFSSYPFSSFASYKKANHRRF